MIVPQIYRAAAACLVAVLFGTSAVVWARPPNCIPDPLNPATCLDPGSLSSILEADGDRYAPRADGIPPDVGRRQRAREDTALARNRARARLTSPQPADRVSGRPIDVKARSASEATVSSQSGAAASRTGAAATSIEGAMAGKLRPSANSAPRATNSAPAPISLPVDQAAHDRVKQRAEARKRVADPKQ